MGGRVTELFCQRGRGLVNNNNGCGWGCDHTCVCKMASTKLLTRYNWKARQQTKRQDLPTDTNKLVLPCKRKDGDVEVEDGSKSKKRKLTDRERKKLRKVLETKEIKKKVSVRVAALVFVFSVQL